MKILKNIYFKKVTLWSVPLGLIVFSFYSAIVATQIDLKTIWPYELVWKYVMAAMISLIIVPLCSWLYSLTETKK